MRKRNKLRVKRNDKKAPPTRRIGDLENLEARELMYAVTGNAWPQKQMVTVSFMPDGTDLARQPSALFSTMNARAATATWQKEILKGMQDYAANASINFVVVADDGSPFGSCGGSGSDCNKQGDSNFGDIRIGAVPLGTSLAVAMLPPPANGDTTAGDIFFNTATTWNVGASYDVHT